MAEKSSKETLRSEVKKHIIKGINEGKYKYGERIVETKLAKALNISQAPVREAVLELSIMGVLEEHPYAGSFVRVPSAEDINNHYSVRGILEAYAAYLAAKNRTEYELNEMRLILHEMSECTSEEPFADLDHRFHEIIMDASRNSVLKGLWQSIATYENTYQTILTHKWSIEALLDAHQKLYDVIAAGNSNAAGAEMFLHLDRFRNDVLAHNAGRVKNQQKESVKTGTEE